MRIFKAGIATLFLTAGAQHSGMGPEQQKKPGTQPTAREVKNDAFLTPDSPSLLDASRRNQLNIASLEQDTCADPFSRKLLTERDAAGWNAMTRAVESGDVALISESLKSEEGRELLKERDGHGRNAMTMAAHKGQVAMIRKFLESEEGRTLLMERDAGGRNAMTKAASKGQVAVISEFLKSEDGRALLTVQDGNGRNAMTKAAYISQVAVIREFLKSEDGRTLLTQRDASGWTAMTKAFILYDSAMMREITKSKEGRRLLDMAFRESLDFFIPWSKFGLGVFLFGQLMLARPKIVKIIKPLVNRLADLYNRPMLTRLAKSTLRTATENALDPTKTSLVKKRLFDFYILKRRINGEPVGPRFQIVGIPNLNEQEQQAIKDIYARCLPFPDFTDTCFISYKELNDGREIGLHGNAFVCLAAVGQWINTNNHSEKPSPRGLKEGLVFGPDQLLIEAQNPLIGNHSGGF